MSRHKKKPIRDTVASALIDLVIGIILLLIDRLLN